MEKPNNWWTIRLTALNKMINLFVFLFLMVLAVYLLIVSRNTIQLTNSSPSEQNRIYEIVAEDKKPPSFYEEESLFDESYGPLITPENAP